MKPVGAVREKAKALIPIPKLLVPAAALAIGIGGKWIATGEVDRDDVANLWTVAGFAAIGWMTPEGK